MSDVRQQLFYSLISLSEGRFTDASQVWLEYYSVIILEMDNIKLFSYQQVWEIREGCYPKTELELFSGYYNPVEWHSYQDKRQVC